MTGSRFSLIITWLILVSILPLIVTWINIYTSFDYDIYIAIGSGEVLLVNTLFMIFITYGTLFTYLWYKKDIKRFVDENKEWVHISKSYSNTMHLYDFMIAVNTVLIIISLILSDYADDISVRF